MTMMKTALAAATTLLVTTAALAAPLKLELADPQPTDLKQGLGVSYYFDSVRTLSDASRAYDKATPGKPLAGLDYRDTAEGDETLTSGEAQKVIAVIEGYVRFDAPGTYIIDFMSNDGLEMRIGGQEVVYFDGVHSCDPSEQVEAVVPEAGWYALEGLYFQRKGSACLMMRAGIGAPEWMENESFGYTE